MNESLMALFRVTEKMITPFIVSLALFMESVDTTIINTAIPAMARSFNVNPVNLKIALISYLLSLAIFIPISGWIADKFGIKRIFMTALLIFTTSSIWCGFSTSITELVIARIIQGLGGSLMLPVGRLILVRTFPRHELITTMSRVVMVAAIGMMLGPLLGGFLTHHFSWQWIFWVNIPVGLITLLLAQIWLRKSAPQKVPPLDKLGFILFGAGLAVLTFGLSSFSETNVNISTACGILCIAIFLLFSYVWHSRGRKHRIVNTALFKSRPFLISILGNLFARFSFGGVPFLLPLLLQIGLGINPQLSGMLLAPTAIGVLLIKPFSLPLLRYFGYKRLLIYNTMLVGAAMWTFMIINASTPLIVIGLLTFGYGFLISLQYSGMSSLGYADLAPEDLSSATSIMSTIQQLALSFGVAVSAMLIRLFSAGPAGTLQLSVGVFHHTFLALGIFTWCSILLFLRLKPEDGNQMIKHETSTSVPMS
jgi:EmrB/QacA subfamily drug resistance transporter